MGPRPNFSEDLKLSKSGEGRDRSAVCAQKGWTQEGRSEGERGISHKGATIRIRKEDKSRRQTLGLGEDESEKTAKVIEVKLKAHYQVRECHPSELEKIRKKRSGTF